MRRLNRNALFLPLAVALLVPVLFSTETFAATLQPAQHPKVVDGAGIPPFYPLQTNPTPDSTVTVVPTSTPQPSPTQPPPPTATPVVSNPTASALLIASRAALKATNTSHFKLVEKLRLGGLLQGTVREQGVVSQRPAAVKAHVTGALTALGKPQKIDEHHVQIGNKAWVKSAKTHGVWKTEKATAPNASGSLQNPLDLVKGNGLKIKSLKTVGAESLGSVSVWHIHGTVIAQVTQTTTTTGTVDYLIGKNGDLPYQIKENVNDPKDGLLLDLHVNMSAFGKKVTIATPRVGGRLQ